MLALPLNLFLRSAGALGRRCQLLTQGGNLVLGRPRGGSVLSFGIACLCLQRGKLLLVDRFDLVKLLQLLLQLIGAAFCLFQQPHVLRVRSRPWLLRLLRAQFVNLLRRPSEGVLQLRGALRTRLLLRTRATRLVRGRRWRLVSEWGDVE